MVMEIVISLIILLVGIAVLVSIHLCVVGRAFGSDDDNNNNGETQQGSNINSNMKGGGDLKNLPCFDYEEEPEKGNNNNLVDCAVCLESFKVGDKCRLLPNCSHSFHVHCIDSWIIKTPFCPICRTWIHQTSLPVVEIEMP